MTFQTALTLLKQGKKLHRSSWLFFGHVAIQGETFQITTSMELHRWRPTEADLLAEDWELIVPDRAAEPESVQLAGLYGSLLFHKGFFEWSDPTGSVKVTRLNLRDALEYARTIR